MKPTKITQSQWKKVLKSLYYSASSGFVGGFMLGLAGAFQTTGASTDLKTAILSGALIGGVVGLLNSLAVTVKQLFTEA